MMEYRLPIVQVQRRGDLVAFGAIQLQSDDELTLQCEPNNPHDSNAIAVLRAGEQIGYVTRAAAADLYRQHGTMTSAVLKICTANYIGTVPTETAAQGSELIDDSHGAQVLQSLSAYRTRVHGIHVDPLGAVQDQLVVLRQLITSDNDARKAVNKWIVPEGAYTTRMPPVEMCEPLVCRTPASRDNEIWDQAIFMQQAKANVELTMVQYGLKRARLSTPPVSPNQDADSLSALASSNLDQDGDFEQLLLMPYSRTPPAFKDALLNGVDMHRVRESLAGAGHSCVLEPTGAKIFVWPEQYSMALHVLTEQKIDLHPSHVVIVESLLPQLQSCIESVPSRHNVRVKKAKIRNLSELPVATSANSLSCATESEKQNGEHRDTTHQAESEDIDDTDSEFRLRVERTFLGFVRTLRDSRSVNQSTTEAHSAINPRRYTRADSTLRSS